MSPDISMCPGTNCPARAKCWRFTATPDALQAYMTAQYDHERQMCLDFWDNAASRCAARTATERRAVGSRGAQ